MRRVTRSKVGVATWHLNDLTRSKGPKNAHPDKVPTDGSMKKAKLYSDGLASASITFAPDQRRSGPTS